MEGNRTDTIWSRAEDLSSFGVQLRLRRDGLLDRGTLSRFGGGRLVFLSAAWLPKGERVWIVLRPGIARDVRLRCTIRRALDPGTGLAIRYTADIEHADPDALRTVVRWLRGLDVSALGAARTAPFDPDDGLRLPPPPLVAPAERSPPPPPVPLQRRGGPDDETEVPLAALADGPIGLALLDGGPQAPSAEVTDDPDTDPAEPHIRPALDGRILVRWQTAAGFRCSWRGGLSQGFLHLHLHSLRAGAVVRLRLELPDGQLLSVQARAVQPGTLLLRLTPTLRFKLEQLAARCEPAG